MKTETRVACLEKQVFLSVESLTKKGEKYLFLNHFLIISQALRATLVQHLNNDAIIYVHYKYSMNDYLHWIMISIFHRIEGKHVNVNIKCL